MRLHRYSVRRMRDVSASKAAITGPVACDARAVGARLRFLRRSAGLTQATVGERLGTTQSAIARLEAGGERLTLRTLERVVAALGCSAQLVITSKKVG